MTRVALLISGTGSNAVRLIEHMRAEGYAAPAVVISNRPNVPGLAKARALDVPTEVVDHTAYGVGREGFEAKLGTTLHRYAPDLVALAGFMRILSADFVAQYSDQLINIHPSLLPDFKGTNTHERVLEAGAFEHGVTVHRVTAELDDGPILGQARLKIRPDDTASSLQRRVQALEHLLYPAVLKALICGEPLPLALEETAQ